MPAFLTEMEGVGAAVAWGAALKVAAFGRSPEKRPPFRTKQIREQKSTESENQNGNEIALP